MSRNDPRRLVFRVEKSWRSWFGVIRVFDGACAYCLTKNVPLTKDHVIPLSRGGGGFDVKNIVPACSPCNGEKGKRTAMEYAKWLTAQGREVKFDAQVLHGGARR